MFTNVMNFVVFLDKIFAGGLSGGDEFLNVVGLKF